MQPATLKSYLDIWLVTRKLREAGRRAPIETTVDPPQTGILDQVWQLERALRDKTPDSEDVGFQPFSQLKALHNDFLQFREELENSLPEGDDGPPPVAELGAPRRRRLQELLTRFEEVFDTEVARHPIFVSTGHTSMLKYLSPQTFLRDETNWRIYLSLPGIAQTCFADGGKCLTYGLSGAAIGLGLQAVEATLRYFHFRNGGDRAYRDWGSMLRDLREKGRLPEPCEYCFQLLDTLRDRYRNAVAHGRAYFEAGKEQATEAEAERIFNDCWTAARMLGQEICRLPNLTIRLLVHPDLDFDTVVATYLFSWNPELPPIRSDAIGFGKVGRGELVDLTMQPSEILRATTARTLSQEVVEYLRPQKNYAHTLDPLLQFVSDCRAGNEESEFTSRSRKDVNLLNLFRGIGILNEQESAMVLRDTWVLLDRFLSSGLSATSPQLVEELDHHAAYQALCTQE